MIRLLLPRPAGWPSARLVSLIALLTLVLAPSAQAAFYGDFRDTVPGTGVTFRNVEDVNGLFGSPTVVVNELIFSPAAFEADCGPDPGCPPSPNTVDDLLTFEVDADAGVVLPRIILREDGSTTIDAGALPLGFAATTVVADVVIDILEVNGASIAGVNVSRSMNISNGGTWDTSADGSASFAWSGTLFVNLDQVLADAGYSGRATRVDVSLANTLTAYGENGATAFIEKDNISGFAVKIVPEPGTALLIGLGLLGLSANGRRARA